MHNPTDNSTGITGVMTPSGPVWDDPVKAAEYMAGLEASPKWRRFVDRVSAKHDREEQQRRAGHRVGAHRHPGAWS